MAWLHTVAKQYYYGLCFYLHCNGGWLVAVLVGVSLMNYRMVT